MNTTTTDLSKFGYRELETLKELLTAMIEQGLPRDFEDRDVTPMFNTYSGSVFLTNSEYQTAMLNGERLESWYYLSYSGQEGFLQDLIEMYRNDEFCNEDLEQLMYILEDNKEYELAEEIAAKLEDMMIPNF